MEITKTQKIIIAIVGVLIFIGIYVVFDNKSKTNPESPTENIATTTDKELVYKVENVTPKPTSELPKPIPDLDRPLTKSPIAVVLDSDTSVAIKNIKELQAMLKNKPSDFPVWMDLAMYQKLGGDYEGALISWKYVGRLAPTDFVSVANIANLYAYFIKDNVKAEEYYKKAISVNSEQPYIYTQLAEFYKDILKDIVKARAIVEEGLKKNPLDETLLEYRNYLK